MEFLSPKVTRCLSNILLQVHLWIIFDGFELVSRFHAPETGEVFVTFKADNHLAISQHFGVWRAKFGLDWNITAVLNDDEVIQRNKQVADAVASMG